MSDVDRFTCIHRPVTSELLVRYATLLNDFNPAHYDLSFASEVGLPGVIGPGTLLQSWMLGDVESQVERPTPASSAPHIVRAIELRLRAPFLVGDAIEMTYVRTGSRLDVEATVAGADPRRVVATATIELAEPTGSVP